MQRSIGKRIRMDEPPPPEYDTTNPMTPLNDLAGIDDNDIQEPYTPYAYNHAQATQLPPSGDTYPTEQQYEVLQVYDHSQSVQSTSQQQIPFDVQGQYDVPSPQPEQGSSESSPTPMSLRGGRITRARLRNAMNPPAMHSPTSPAQKRLRMEDKGMRARRALPRKTYAEHSGNDDISLYQVIKLAKITLEYVVDDWIESYKVSRDNALLALMQFFIHASGCKGTITPNMAANMEHAAIIRRMTEEFDEESGEYPFIMSGQVFKKFRTSFCEFIALLVKHCQYCIIYDQYLMDNIISLLTGLSDSQVRAFRHTATLAAMKLMTALVDVALVVSVNLDNTQRQYESERQKTREKRASDRLENLLTNRQELEENMDEIKNMLTYMFKSVFVHRYRDTLPEIRSICMSEIGIWMKKFHQNFLDDSYLKYIGWTLHDKVGEVRLKCLQALQPLYATEDLKGKLELFTSKFKDRIVAMTLDKEYDVAVQAVRLVISILKHHRDILTDKDCEHVYELVYSSNRAVAQAAGEFLNERLFVPDEAVSTQRTLRGKKRLPNTPLIRDLVQFFIESELHEHGAYLVDSLIESNAMMKDWECMTDLLLEEPGPNEEPLDDRQETSLIEIMVCCVKQASTGDAPVGRGTARKVTSVKEIKQVQDDKQKLTEHFITVLPQLLDKYSADTDKLTNLMCIPQHFLVEIYTTSRQEACLDVLLLRIHNIIEKHHDTEVLETSAKTLEFLCTEGYAIYTRCDVKRSTMIDFLVNKYKEAMDDWNSLIEGGETPDDDETFNALNGVKKISIFYSCHSLGKWNIWQMLFKDVEEAKDGVTNLPDKAVKYCISGCYFGLLWELHYIEELIESGGPTSDKIVEVNIRLNKFMDTMKFLLAQSDYQLYKEEAYTVICDMLVVFCNQLVTNSNTTLASLVYEPDKALQDMLNDFIQNNVFLYEEDETLDEHSKIAELHKRRNFLASYCKLIVYSILPISCAADIFKHYVKSYNEYGDIIKTTVGKAREINKVNCARTMVNALIAIFKDLQSSVRGIRMRNLEDFVSLKELAKRFALSFGLDAVKNREAVTILHREGILFAVNPGENVDDPTGPPPNLLFLEILTEFTNKLLKQDKRIVLTYLDRRISMGMPSSRGEDWQPLLLYRNSLVHGETDQPPVTSKRAYSRKRKDALEDGIFDDPDEGASDSEFTPGIDIAIQRKQLKAAYTTPSPQFNSASPINYSVESLAASSRPQRQCAKLSYCYIENFSDDEIA